MPQLTQPQKPLPASALAHKQQTAFIITSLYQLIPSLSGTQNTRLSACLTLFIPSLSLIYFILSFSSFSAFLSHLSAFRRWENRSHESRGQKVKLISISQQGRETQRLCDDIINHVTCEPSFDIAAKNTDVWWHSLSKRWRTCVWKHVNLCLGTNKKTSNH